MTNPNYLLAIANKNNTQEEYEYNEPDLFERDELKKIKDYISKDWFRLTIVRPNYDRVYKEEKWYNYDDHEDKWEIIKKPKECSTVTDVKNYLKSIDLSK